MTTAVIVFTMFVTYLTTTAAAIGVTFNLTGNWPFALVTGAAASVLVSTVWMFTSWWRNP